MNTAAQPRAATRARVQRLVGRLLALLAALALAAYLAVSSIAANVLTTPRRSFSEQRTPAAFGLPYQEVRFEARGDDVQIAGWYLPRQASGAAVVLVHGKDSSRTAEFGGRFIDLAAALHERGFAVLMIDMRGHGQSGDAHFSFGLNERRDVLGAVDWLQAQGFEAGAIGVLGISMGAAASIGAAAEETAIGALVEDSSYAEIYPIIAKEWRVASGLPEAFLPSSLLMARLLFGADIAAARPIDEIDEVAPRPVLIIHGAGDQLIPPADAGRLQAAAPSAALWQVAGARHAGSYDADPQAYTERVVSFFERNLGPR